MPKFIFVLGLVAVAPPRAPSAFVPIKMELDPFVTFHLLVLRTKGDKKW